MTQHLNGSVFDSGMPVWEDGDVGGSSTHGPFFNWRGRKAECDWVNWEAPDGQVFRIALIIPCPQCQFPQIYKADPNLYRISDDGQLSFSPMIRCPAHWIARDPDSGQVIIGANGAPRRAECRMAFVIREGVAHHPACAALHHPGCAVQQGRCTCGGRWGGLADCNCGAAQDVR